MKMINSFEGNTYFLSNFFEKEFTFLTGSWKSAEHAFQAMKTLDSQEQEWVRSAPTPGIAKRRGRVVKLRPDWEQIKDFTMEAILRAKFSDPELKRKLILTCDYGLCEGNTWHDNYWGDCSCPKCAGIVGRNQLGKTLMKIREDLINEMLERRRANGSEIENSVD